MKNIARKLSALLLVFVVSAAALCPAFAASASLPSLPSGQCVVDDANVLSSSTVQTITDLNAQLESSCSGAQIGVLTVDYTGNLTTEDYALQAFNTWGIGSSSENNGVLILLVMESPIYEDGDYYVTYGDGFRNTTLESQASALAQTMEGDFVNRDYSDAVITCANNVADTIASVYGVNLNNGSYDDGSYAEPDDGPTTFEDVVLGIVILFMSLMVMLIIVLFVFRVFIAPIGHAVGCYRHPQRVAAGLPQDLGDHRFPDRGALPMKQCPDILPIPEQGIGIQHRHEAGILEGHEPARHRPAGKQHKAAPGIFPDELAQGLPVRFFGHLLQVVYQQYLPALVIGGQSKAGLSGMERKALTAGKQRAGQGAFSVAAGGKQPQMLAAFHGKAQVLQNPGTLPSVTEAHMGCLKSHGNTSPLPSAPSA